MFKKFVKSNIKTLLAVIWFAFTFSLVTWWWIFILNQIKGTESFLRMVAWEGSILLAAIFLGGTALIIFSHNDQKQNQRLRFFFSTFSHDIKTSISRLRLQADVLEENLQSERNPVLKRLINDIFRLDLQLENSLFLSSLEAGKLLSEQVSLNELLSSLRSDFSDLTIDLEKEVHIHGDRRALLSIFRNILQNSVLHGNADLVKIETVKVNDKKVEISISDNGSGFHGDVKKLGAQLLSSTSQQGNGIGLFICKRLLQNMDGDLRFESNSSGRFKSILSVVGSLA